MKNDNLETKDDKRRFLEKNDNLGGRKMEIEEKKNLEDFRDEKTI